MAFAFEAYGANQAKKYAEEQERYRNGMRKVQEAHAQNAITVQEIYSQVDTKRKNLANEIEYMGAKGTMEVHSAVSGFSGRTSRAISNAALRAKTLRTASIEEGHNRSRRNFEINRMNSALGTEMSLEDGWVQNPNYVAMAEKAVVQATQAMTSDRRLKKNIEFVRVENGHRIYHFDYIGREGRFEGVLAQEVLEINPDAVVKGTGGMLGVIYSKIGIEMKEVSNG